MSDLDEHTRAGLQNFSRVIRVLLSPIVFDRLNSFEKIFIINMLKYTDKETYKTISMGLQIRTYNMYGKYVGYKNRGIV